MTYNALNFEIQIFLQFFSVQFVIIIVSVLLKYFSAVNKFCLIVCTLNCLFLVQFIFCTRKLYGLGGTRDPIYFACDFFKNSLVTQETMRVMFDALSLDCKSPEISPTVDVLV